MPDIHEQRLAIVDSAYLEVQQALQALAADRHITGRSEYTVAYELLRREVIDFAVFRAWDALRMAYELYTQTGRPPEPSGLSRFLALAHQVTAALRRAGQQPAAA